MMFHTSTCLHLLYDCPGNNGGNNALMSYSIHYVSKSNLNQRVTKLIDGDGSIQKTTKETDVVQIAHILLLNL